MALSLEQMREIAGKKTAEQDTPPNEGGLTLEKMKEIRNENVPAIDRGFGLDAQSSVAEGGTEIKESTPEPQVATQPEIKQPQSDANLASRMALLFEEKGIPQEDGFTVPKAFTPITSPGEFKKSPIAMEEIEKRKQELQDPKLSQEYFQEQISKGVPITEIAKERAEASGRYGENLQYLQENTSEEEFKAMMEKSLGTTMTEQQKRVGETATGLSENFIKEAEAIDTNMQKGDIGFAEASWQHLGNIAKAGVEGGEDLVLESIRGILPDSAEKLTGDAFKASVEALPDNVKEGVGNFFQNIDKWKEENPRAVRNIQPILSAGEVVLDLLGLKAGEKGVETIIDKVPEVIKKVPTKVSGVRRIPEAKRGSVLDMLQKKTEKLTKNERLKALEQGRVVPTKKSWIFGKKPDTIIPSERTKDVASTIEKVLGKQSKNLNEIELRGRLSENIKKTSSELGKDLSEQVFEKDLRDRLTDRALGVMETQADEILFTQFPGAPKIQERFLKVLDKIDDKTTVNDLWGMRKEYDKSMRKSIKAGSPTDGFTAYQREVWLENRALLNEAIKEAAEKLPTDVGSKFKDMNAFYEGINLIDATDPVDVKGVSGVFTTKNLAKKAIGAGAAALGIKAVIE